MSEIKKFSAVFWMDAKTHSIINSDQLLGDVKVGCTAYAWYKKKPYEIRLLRMSDDINELKNIKVTKDGFLREFNNADALALSSKVAALKEVKQAAKTGKSKTKKSATKSQDMLPIIHDGLGSEGKKGGNALDQLEVQSNSDNALDQLEVQSNSDNALDQLDVQSNSDKIGHSTAHEKGLAEKTVEKTQNNIMDLKDSSKSVTCQVLPASSQIKESEATPLPGITSQDCDDTREGTYSKSIEYIPVPSEEVLRFLENACNVWRKLRSSGATSTTMQETPSSLSFQTTTDMVPLLAKYPQILIDRRVLKGITRLNKENPTSMALRLLNALVEDDILHKCTAGIIN